MVAWIDDPDNPFNQMSWTRGGGGYDNPQTHESNERRASAMVGSTYGALPRFATAGIAQAALPAKSLAVVGDNVIRTRGAGTRSVQSGPGGGKGAGSRLVLAVPKADGFASGVLGWQRTMAFSEAPEIDGIENQPLKRVGIGGPQEAPGALSDIGWVRTATGYLPVPSGDAKERIEDDIILQTMWSARNYLMPHLGLTPYPFPDFMDPKYSHFDQLSGEWRHGGADRGTGYRTGGGF